MRKKTAILTWWNELVNKNINFDFHRLGIMSEGTMPVGLEGSIFHLHFHPLSKSTDGEMEKIDVFAVQIDSRRPYEVKMGLEWYKRFSSFSFTLILSWKENTNLRGASSRFIVCFVSAAALNVCSINFNKYASWWGNKRKEWFSPYASQ